MKNRGRKRRQSLGEINRAVAGERIVRIVEVEHGLVLEFAGGSALAIEARGGVAVSLRPGTDRASGGTSRATRRQQDYLEFITRFMARFGVAPVESDIQRHFLVSAPSVNQMVRTLEAKGLITRQRDLLGYVLPRSIRLVDSR